ncbi:NAD-dependent epimerase/dehydratase family protein [Pseudonocardia xinjiangensis]|uniref:NAD-dependent epimerase/dehydratase family protein n=1 Tax=Pseudonocardia xinjiangensis TaxID=75289 RepID=UPI003D927CA5
MRIAVTGAGGKLGRHVVARALLAGHDVVAVDLPAALGELQQSHFDATTLPQSGFAASVECRAADLTQFDEVRAALAGTDAVAHLGALIHPRYPEPVVHHTNVGGTHHVLVAAEEHGLGAVCLASSVNAIGGIFSATPRYDYFPIDEEHPTYCEDSYSLSKWIGEQQMAAFARRRPTVTFSALRLHALRQDFAAAHRPAEDDRDPRELWGWTSFDSAAAACLLALHRSTPGPAVYNIVAARTSTDVPSEELARRWYPDAPLRRPLPRNTGFWDTGRALAELGWDAEDEHPALSDRERNAR